MFPSKAKLKATKLTRTIKTKDGSTLKNLNDAAHYMLELPEDRSTRRQWKHVVELIRDEAEPGKITDQITLALLYDGHLVFEK
jgi:hypothetical protein